jgi:hypothetical protein
MSQLLNKCYSSMRIAVKWNMVNIMTNNTHDTTPYITMEKFEYMNVNHSTAKTEWYI